MLHWGRSKMKTLLLIGVGIVLGVGVSYICYRLVVKFVSWITVNLMR